MRSKRIEYLLLLFDIFGYNSGSSKLSRNQRTACFIYVVHILFAMLYSLFKIHLIFQIISLPIIELINSLFQYSVALYFYWFIVADSIFYTREHQSFWETLQKIENFFSYRKPMTFNRLILKLVVYYSTSLWCTIAINLLDTYENSYKVCIYFMLVKICEFRVFFYMFCVEVLYNQMESITTVFKENKYDKRFLLQSNEFQSIRKCYSHIYEMTDYLNKIFGLSQVIASTLG